MELSIVCAQMGLCCFGAPELFPDSHHFSKGAFTKHDLFAGNDDQKMATGGRPSAGVSDDVENIEMVPLASRPWRPIYHAIRMRAGG